MNENLNLVEILKGCPIGTKLYSSVYGEVEFGSCTDVGLFPIRVTNGYHNYKFSNYGRIYPLLGECTLFPSKDQRDWSKFERFWDKAKVEKFDPNTLQPFDRVLVRCSNNLNWQIGLFGYKYGRCISSNGAMYYQCIPYNDITKHLLGTSNDCPDYYKWWEEM